VDTSTAQKAEKAQEQHICIYATPLLLLGHRAPPPTFLLVATDSIYSSHTTSPLHSIEAKGLHAITAMRKLSLRTCNEIRNKNHSNQIFTILKNIRAIVLLVLCRNLSPNHLILIEKLSFSFILQVGCVPPLGGAGHKTTSPTNPFRWYYYYLCSFSILSFSAILTQ
jgi:hypothetical protein